MSSSPSATHSRLVEALREEADRRDLIQAHPILTGILRMAADRLATLEARVSETRAPSFQEQADEELRMRLDHPNTPSAIYVWLVPSEEVQEQPGSWRIRKWDTEPFPEANYTLSAPSATRTPITQEFAEFIGRLQDLAHTRSFWEEKPYSNRLYYGIGAGDYIARDILGAFLHAIKNAAPQEEHTDAAGTPASAGHHPADAAEFTVGDYTMRPGLEKGKVWIEHESGEGGDFPMRMVEAAIHAFYKEHF